MDKIPVVNGNVGKSLVIGAFAALIALFVAVTIIIVAGDVVPDFFYTTGTLLVGFLIGSRVITPDVSKQVLDKANTEPASTQEAGTANGTIH
jgi:hypothetical protein